jgi:Tfp pilus assembly protein PilF
VLALALALIAVAPAGAQKKEKVPKRPKVNAAADTNDWQVYHQAGLASLRTRPDRAAEAFYWASRLDPSRAEPLYARWAALWMARPEHLWEYWRGAEYVVNSGESQRIDSLRWRASLRNPFVHQGPLRLLLATMWDTRFGEGNWDWSGSGDNLAWLDYTEGRFGEAAARLAVIMAKDQRRFDLHYDRALALHGMGRHDSAAAELATLVEEMNKRDRKRLVRFYESRAMYEYQAGIAHLLGGQTDQAREAFMRALSEDLSMYMAHGALGGVALALGDTAMALNEYGQAVQLNGTDPSLRTDYGLILLANRQYTDAAEQLRMATELEPYFATPYYYLGIALDNAGQKAGARTAYTEFVSRAPRRMGPQINQAKQRATALAGELTATNR